MSVKSWAESNFDTKFIAGNIQINCPFCNDTQFHFGIHPKKRVANCFRASCGWKGSVLDLVMQYENCNFSRAIKIIGASDEKKFSEKEYKDAVRRFRGDRSKKSEIEMPEGFRGLDTGSRTGKACLRYLMNKRGMSTEQIAEIGAGICDMDKYSGYVVIPVTEKGQVVYYVARQVIKMGGPKYVFPSNEEVGGYGKSNWLFNRDKASRYSRVYIAEGVFDAIALGEMAVCTFGTKLSDMQHQKLVQAGHKRATIVLDEDALDDSYEMAERLRPHMKVDVIKMEDGDPSDLEGDLTGLESEKITSFTKLKRRLGGIEF